MEHALELNRMLQVKVKMELQKIEEQLLANQKMQARVELLIKEAAVVRKTSRCRIASFCPMLNKSRPNDNDDALVKHAHGTTPLYAYGKWTPKELAQLQTGVVTAMREKMLNDVLEKNDRLHHSASALDLEAFQATMKNIREMTSSEVLAQYVKLPPNTSIVNWERLQKEFVPTHTPCDCKVQWEHHLSPAVAFLPEWSADEDKRLIALASKYDEHNWGAIAEELGTGRQAFECCARFQRSLNHKLLKKQWTKSDDEKLRAAVQLYGEQNWQMISSRLDGFTGQQCMHRWTKALRPTITHGKWTEDEDKRLIMGVAFYGSKGWNEVSRCVRTKTDVQCRERWANVLSPDVRQGAWTKEEDEILLREVEKHGLGKWSLVARAIPNRTDNHCWRRWKELKRDNQQEDEVHMYCTEVRQKRRSLPTVASRRPQDRSSITLAQLQEVGRSTAEETDDNAKSKARIAPKRKRGKTTQNKESKRSRKRRKKNDGSVIEEESEQNETVDTQTEQNETVEA